MSINVYPLDDDKKILISFGPLAQPGRTSCVKHECHEHWAFIYEDKSSDLLDDEETQWSRVRIPHGPLKVFENEKEE